MRYLEKMISRFVRRWFPSARQAMDLTTGTPKQFCRAIQESKRKSADEAARATTPMCKYCRTQPSTEGVSCDKCWTEVLHDIHDI